MPSSITVRVIKFDVNSPTDKVLLKMQHRLTAQTMVETIRRCLIIADKVMQKSNEGFLYVKSEDGQFHQLIIL